MTVDQTLKIALGVLEEMMRDLSELLNSGNLTMDQAEGFLHSLNRVRHEMTALRTAAQQNPDTYRRYAQPGPEVPKPSDN